MSQLAFTRKKSTRRCTQLTRSSIDASWRGMSASISDASAPKPNSMVAEIRESVVKGAVMSGTTGGFSAANEADEKPIRPRAARLMRADLINAARGRYLGAGMVFMTLTSICCWPVRATLLESLFRNDPGHGPGHETRLRRRASQGGNRNAFPADLRRRAVRIHEVPATHVLAPPD